MFVDTVEMCVSVSELIVYMRCGYTGLYIHEQR